LIQLSIVVNFVKLNNLYRLEGLLEALSRQTSKNFEVILVSRESLLSDKSLLNLLSKYKRSYPIRVFKEPESGGLSKGRNLGLVKSRAENIAFIDDDAIPTINWVKSINESLVEYDGVTGPVEPIFESPACLRIPRELFWIFSCSYIPVKDKTIFYDGFGVNMAFKRRILLEIGGFNEKLGIKIDRKIWIGGEDTELFHRLRYYGYKVVWNTNMKVYHVIGPERCHPRNVLSRAKNVGFSRAIMNKCFEHTRKTSFRIDYVHYFSLLTMKKILKGDLAVLWNITVALALILGYLRGIGMNLNILSDLSA
jgi:glycosyltransferase involved in cell wall biosynthesis